MKAKYSFFVLLAACSMAHGSLFAQDRVITKKGDVMEVYNVEVSDKYIFFNREKSADSAFERLVKDSVLMIRRQDGSIVNLGGAEEGTVSGGADAQVAAVEAPQPEAVILTPDMLDGQARQSNAASIARMNASVVFDPKEPSDLKKKANYVWFRMGVKENSVLDDGMVSLEMTGGNFRKKENSFMFVENSLYNSICPGLQVRILNKSDRTIYIDLAKCFLTRMGQSQCYYVPSATSVTSTSGSGVGINAGAVAGALGVGGVVGTLASGVNVGGGGSKGSTTVTYAQRMISVPPHATVSLDAQFLFGSRDCTIVPGLHYSPKDDYVWNVDNKLPRFSFPKDAPEGPLMNGQHFSYDEARSILPVSALVAYSFSEDCSALRTLSAHLYLRDVVGLNLNHLKSIFRGRILTEPGTLGFYGELDNSKGATSFPRK